MIKKHIPNAITCCNLICGCIGITLVLFNGDLFAGFTLMIAACVFDFFDGFTARLLNVSSPIGKELDSLADVVSFGVLPAMMLVRLTLMDGIFAFHEYGDGCDDFYDGLVLTPMILLAAAFLIPAFSALRLAKFNLDERQTSEFLGLPTPANALLWGGMIATYNTHLLQSPYIFILLAAVPLTCWLLVSEVPMFSLKFHDAKWANNWHRYIFLAGIVLLAAVLRFEALAWVIVWYLVWNAIYQIVEQRHKK